MRRADKEITDPKMIAKIIGSCQVCRVGVAKENIPYIIPVSFGYDGDALYIHTAQTGRKIGFFEANPKVCVEFEHGVTLKPHENDPCSWSFSFQSVIGYGVIHELTDYAEIMAGLQLIMKQYSKQEWSFTKESIAPLKVWKIAIESLSGKQSKDMALS
jgi:nitroimidazol reductase NimA-like FMN-containing flavoprotein (pyridoxamine 5'-phosphate oxidase superfamily)